MEAVPAVVPIRLPVRTQAICNPPRTRFFIPCLSSMPLLFLPLLKPIWAGPFFCSSGILAFSQEYKSSILYLARGCRTHMVPHTEQGTRYSHAYYIPHFRIKSYMLIHLSYEWDLSDVNTYTRTNLYKVLYKLISWMYIFNGNICGCCFLSRLIVSVQVNVNPSHFKPH